MIKIRQFFATLIGFGAFAFVFYLVFGDDMRFMIGLGAVVVGIILIVVIVGLIGRIKDKAEEKRRMKPFNH
jgi:peptidoglycan/LPS O-acetylase OafA/YrhL